MILRRSEAGSDWGSGSGVVAAASAEVTGIPFREVLEGGGNREGTGEGTERELRVGNPSVDVDRAEHVDRPMPQIVICEREQHRRFDEGDRSRNDARVVSSGRGEGSG